MRNDPLFLIFLIFFGLAFYPVLILSFFGELSLFLIIAVIQAVALVDTWRVRKL